MTDPRYIPVDGVEDVRAMLADRTGNLSLASALARLVVLISKATPLPPDPRIGLIEELRDDLRKGRYMNRPVDDALDAILNSSPNVEGGTGQGLGSELVPSGTSGEAGGITPALLPPSAPPTSESVSPLMQDELTKELRRVGQRLTNRARAVTQWYLRNDPAGAPKDVRDLVDAAADMQAIVDKAKARTLSQSGETP